MIKYVNTTVFIKVKHLIGDFSEVFSLNVFNFLIIYMLLFNQKLKLT